MKSDMKNQNKQIKSYPASVYSYSRVRDKMKIAEISLWVETGMQFILPLGALYA